MPSYSDAVIDCKYSKLLINSPVREQQISHSPSDSSSSSSFGSLGSFGSESSPADSEKSQMRGLQSELAETQQLMEFQEKIYKYLLLHTSSYLSFPSILASAFINNYSSLSVYTPLNSIHWFLLLFRV